MGGAAWLWICPCRGMSFLNRLENFNSHSDVREPWFGSTHRIHACWNEASGGRAGRAAEGRGRFAT
jgi:hypothetical protein